MSESTFKPTGKARRWTAREVAELSRLTPDDAADARRLWRRRVGRKYRGVIDARVSHSPVSPQRSHFV
jgi:hypothetical protein